MTIVYPMRRRNASTFRLGYALEEWLGCREDAKVKTLEREGRLRFAHEVIAATREVGAALPGLAIADTVKRIDDAGRVRETLDRSVLRLAQTPQGSRSDWLIEALDRAGEEGFAPTDEAAALERAGRPVALVAGDPGNFKITSSEDLDRARRRLHPQHRLPPRAVVGRR